MPLWSQRAAAPRGQTRGTCLDGSGDTRGRVRVGALGRGVEGVSVRSRVQKISPEKAAEMLAANTANRPLSRSTVQAFAEAMRRGDWLVTHQGIAVDTNGVLVDGQHRLAAVIEARAAGGDDGVHRGRAGHLRRAGHRANATPRTCWRSRGRSRRRRWRRWCGRCGSSRTGRRRPGRGVGRR